jgi:hypothetical protein
MVLDNPLYFQTDTPLPGVSDDTKRLWVFVNLRLQDWLMRWKFGDLTETELRGYLTGLFDSKAGRAYWKRFGEARSEYEANTKRERSFHQIVNRVYEQRVASGPTADNDSVNHVAHRAALRSSRVTRVAVTLAAAVAAGALIDRIASHERSRNLRRVSQSDR